MKLLLPAVFLLVSILPGALFARPNAETKAQLRELITGYDPAVLWFDGEWQDWWTEANGRELYRYVRSLKPDIIINNRVGRGRQGMQGMNKNRDE